MTFQKTGVILTQNQIETHSAAYINNTGTHTHICTIHTHAITHHHTHTHSQVLAHACTYITITHTRTRIDTHTISHTHTNAHTHTHTHTHTYGDTSTHVHAHSCVNTSPGLPNNSFKRNPFSQALFPTFVPWGTRATHASSIASRTSHNIQQFIYYQTYPMCWTRLIQHCPINFLSCCDMTEGGEGYLLKM